MKKLLIGSMILLIFSLSLAVFQASSCKKSIAQTPCKTDTVYLNSSIKGLWEGSYQGSGSSQGSGSYTLVLNSDGTMINQTRVSGDTSSLFLNTGTWQLFGDTLKLAYINVYGKNSNTFLGDVQTASALYNSANGTLTGGIYNDLTISGSGTFTETKVE